MSRRTRDGDRFDRGQTAVDFAIAMGLFLVALVIVISFLPAMIDPFAGTPSENPLIADRIANQLTDYQLAGSTAGTLDTVCTVYFFAGESQDECDTFDGDEPLNERIGVGDEVRVNVTVERNAPGGESEILCGNTEDHEVVDSEDCDPEASDEHRLAAGDSPSIDGTVAIARRGVYLDGRQSVTLYVRVWA